MFENPNLIPRIIRRQESSVSRRPLFRSHSCLVEWIFLEDLAFDEYFETSLFRTTSDGELLDLVQDPEFIRELEIQQANWSIDRNLLNSPHSSLTTNRAPELSETTSISFSSSLFPHLSEVQSTPPFIPSLPLQPITTQHPTTTSSSSSTTQTPPVTPTPVPTSTQHRIMANRYAPLVTLSPQGVMQ